jgi:DNA mismatch endonuclease (patch repair protein)
MADIWSIEKRSEVMGRIRSSGNAKTELRLIELMRQHRITGWRRNQPLIGKPDFTFRAERLLVFVDGCFWHGCPTCFRAPTSNESYWTEKIEGNRARDKRVAANLRRAGWRVMRIWEHELQLRPEHVAVRLLRALAKEDPYRGMRVRSLHL